MHTSQGPASLTTHLLGPHPIVEHFIQRLHLPAIVHQTVGHGREPIMDHGTTLAVLIHNILDSPAPLYRIAEWASPIAPQALSLTPEQKQSLQDDRVARMLDALVSERARGLWFRLALRLIKQFKVDTDRVHHDTTTVTFHGRYATSVSEPRITHGHNKDHRPDLKQFLFGLSVSSDGAVPLTHQVLSGNRADDTVHRSNLEELRALLGREDFIYVADGKLGTSANLRDIASHGGRFVTVLSRNRREDEEFRDALRKKAIRWKTIHENPRKRSAADPPDRFASCAGSPKTAEGYRLIWIRSSAKASEDHAFRQHQVERARTELSLLSRRLNRRQLRSARPIRAAVRQLLKQTGMERFVEVLLARRIQETIKRLKPGRPSPTDPVRVVKTMVWSLKVQINRNALRQEKRVDGVFPLVTNLEKTPKKRVLLIYKYQPYVEKRFSQLKTDLEVAPVYLKKPRRCAGLVHAYFAALTVASLIERAVRNGMQREGINQLPLFPEGRMTATPTCPRILEAFRGVSWHQFSRGEETVCFPIKLSPLQKTLLRLLEVPMELYR